MLEEWKNIIGYNGKYQISNCGNIKSYKRYREGKILSPTKDKDGYLQIGLRDKNSKRKWYRIHRLVANAFIPNPNNFTEINHKDNNPSNNNVENLEWCTIEYNNKYRFTHGNGNNRGENGSCAKLTNKQAREIYYLSNSGKFSCETIGKMYGVKRWCVQSIKSQKSWKSVTYNIDINKQSYPQKHYGENNKASIPCKVINKITNEEYYFTTIKDTASFTNIPNSTLRKKLKRLNNIVETNIYIIYKLK